jgi:hypothetical protein
MRRHRATSEPGPTSAPSDICTGEVANPNEANPCVSRILIRSPSLRGVAEEAPEAYKDVGAVVDAAQAAGLARKVVRFEPMIVVKG